jgi:hypothetical protein
MSKADDFLAKAKAEIGTAEGPKDNETKYGKFTKHDFQPWCGSFIMWCCNEIGYKAMPNVVYTPAGAEAFKGKGAWANPLTAKPAPGDIVFFNFSGKGIEHVGIVVKDNGDGTITTIEGNTSPEKKPSGSQANGGEVAQRIRAFKASPKTKLLPFVAGFGRPDWSK